MKKAIKKHLLLEQLEDRIFLSASPIAAVGPMDHVAEPEPVDLHAHDTLALTTETPAQQHTATVKETSSHQETGVQQQADPAGSETATENGKSDGSAEQNSTQETTGQNNNETDTVAAPTTDNTAQVNAEAAGTTDTTNQATTTEATTSDDSPAAEAAQETSESAASGESTDPAESTVPTSNADSVDEETIEQAAEGIDTENYPDLVTEQPADIAESIAVDEDINQIVFVDSSVTDHETLLSGIIDDIASNGNDSEEVMVSDTSNQVQNGIQIITLDASGDEFQQITDSLAGYSNLDGIHILSHGSNSSLRLGGMTIDNNNLDEYSVQLAQWGNALSEEGDLLLYGCNVAGDGTGVDFIESMASITGADVAASDDATGNEASGGDWDLEVATGTIDVNVLHDADGNWDGLLAPPDPIAGGSVTDAQPMLNSVIGFSVTFDNDVNSDDADEGYWPYVDILVPSSVDIQGGPTVFGSPATYQTFTWNGASWDGASEHPYNSHGVNLSMPTGTSVGDVWYLVDLPFGSFVMGQPVASIDFEAEISTAGGAVAGTDIDIEARAGFRFGDTPTNDNGPIEQGGTHITTITPRVLDIEKINDAPEGQTVTGPNYPVEYTLTVNVANGETVDDVIVTDYLPENAVYRGDYTVTPINGAAAVAPVVNHEPAEFTVLGPDSADRLLEINLGNLTGVNDPASGTSEYQITYTVYFSNVDSSGNPLLDPASGDDENVMNESSISGDYNGGTVVDGTDSALGSLNDDASDSITPSDNQIEIDSIVTYKNAANLNGNGTEILPGDVVVWTIEVDVSDYFGVGNVVLDDVFGDGQTFIDGVNAGHADQLVPTLEIWENGVHTASESFDAANYTVGTESDLNAAGDTALQFRVSDQLVSMGQDSFLDGGFFADESADGAQQSGDALNGRLNGDATRIFIVYRTVVDQSYDKLHNTVGHSGDPSIDIGDTIVNDVTVTADIVDNPTDHNTIGTEEDLSSAVTTVPDGTVLKEIYAVNGDINYDLNQGVTSGDRITYHLRMDLPTADFELLKISDFLPLPAYDALEISSNTGNDFNGSIEFSGGEVEFGPDHNLNSTDIPGLNHNGVAVGATPLTPGLTVDGDNNSILLDFGSYDTADPAADGMTATIDILITVTIQNNPMADELLLTNQGEWTLNDTNLTPDEQVDIVPIQLNEPEVQIVKGVVATDGNGVLGADQGPEELTFNADGTISVVGSVESQELADNPVDADLSNADGSDLVTFAITVYNTGGANAYDINVTDTLPTGFVEPAGGINLNVYDGTGFLLTEGAGADYTVTGGGFLCQW